jgi:hypothetical protein
MSTWREKPTSPDDLRAAIHSYGAPPDDTDIGAGRIMPRPPIETIPPRVRRNYTQGANGLWRAEFTVESYHDPRTRDGITHIEDEDASVSLSVRKALAVLNHRGTPEAPVPT